MQLRNYLKVNLFWSGDSADWGAILYTSKGCGFNPLSGCIRKATDQSVSLSLSLSLPFPSPPPLKPINISLSEKIFNYLKINQQVIETQASCIAECEELKS